VQNTLLHVFGDVALTGALGFELFSREMTGVEIGDVAVSNTFGARSGVTATEEERALDEFPVLQLPVVLNDSAIEEGDEDWKVRR
jgi:hypothetical protein